MKDLDEAKKILGVEIYREQENKITLTQKQYLKKVL